MKMIQVLSDCSHPEKISFETAIDSGGMENANFSYHFGDIDVDCKRVASNKWCVDGQIPSTLKIAYINPKTLVGAFEKSFLYDDVGKKPKQEQKIEYVIRQAKKILQNKQKESGKKKEWYLNPSTISMVNEILQLRFDDIQIVKHKYFSGTWATNVFFSDGANYSEYNAGSGEFLVAIILDQISKLPDNALLLLDEPEISLHPGAQKRFMRCLLEIVKKKKLQVIISTHSASIIDNLPPEAIVGLKRVEQLITAEGNLNYKYA